MRILIVEDEPKVAEFLKQGLVEQNHKVDVAYDGQIGERLAVRGQYDLILLDVVVPFINGFELCRRIRIVNPSVPIIMLTALGATDDKLTGFDAGADDYLVKPFEFKELMARIKALTKRSITQTQQQNTVRVDDLILDLDKKMARRSGHAIELTAKEFALLEYLMRNQGRVVSRPEIAEKIWEITFDTGTNVVDVYINILRRKIDKLSDKKLIHTKIGIGYYIESK